MPLTAAAANIKTQAINDAFAAIGTSKGNGSAMPKSKRNDEPFAAEYFVSAHLARLADARKAAAIKAAVKALVMFDPEKQPMAEGTNALIYAGDYIEISVAVGTPQTRLDFPAYVAELEASGVARKLLDKLAAKHTHDNRAPHKFQAVLCTSR